MIEVLYCGSALVRSPGGRLLARLDFRTGASPDDRLSILLDAIDGREVIHALLPLVRAALAVDARRDERARAARDEGAYHCESCHRGAWDCACDPDPPRATAAG